VSAPFAAAALVGLVFGAQAMAPALRRRARAVVGGTPEAAGAPAFDPGRELRAEQRARELLRSCVGEEEWGMYRDLGFISVGGAVGPEPGYAYLIYPHRPIVAYVPGEARLLSEYCVRFPDTERPYGSDRLPDADDVLAKWLALSADERGLVAAANMHLPGRQVDPEKVERDIRRLETWRRRAAHADASVRAS